jgi:lipid II:glycine glycyltransferase (peptidoglycan interpeptide bridge formation enzyme)
MKVRKPSREEWQEILDKCTHATFFATPDWAEVVEKTYCYKTDTKLFLFGDGQKVIVPLSIIGKSYRIFAHYISVPFHNYGGLFSDREISDLRIRKIIDRLKSGLKMDVTLCPHPFSNARYPDDYITDEYSTHILDLTQGFESIWSKYKDRDQARKARKEGVTIRLGNSIDDFKTYYEMYCASAKRWGLKDPQPYMLYENLCGMAGSRLKLWFANYNEKDIAGIILAYFNEIVVYYGAAFYYEYEKLRPNNLLLIEAIKDACNRRYKYFDFLPSAGIEGVEKFKKSFGAEKHKFNSYHLTGKYLDIISNLRKIIQ